MPFLWLGPAVGAGWVSDPWPGRLPCFDGVQDRVRSLWPSKSDSLPGECRLDRPARIRQITLEILHKA